MVEVEIEDGGVSDAVVLDSMLNPRVDVVYEAEAAWCIFPTMMTGWADSNKCSGGVELGRVTRRVDYSINCLTDSAKSPLDRIQRFWTYYIGRVLSQYAEDVKGRI